MGFDFDAVIFDIGDVLCTYSLPKKDQTTLSPKLLRNILSSPIWFDHERGILDQETCYRSISTAFCVDVEDIRLALNQARETLTFTPQMISLLHDIKQYTRIFAMSNISMLDFEYMSSKFDFSIFDGVYTSYAVGERKPDLAFYRHVLTEIGGKPHRMIFVDDRPENVLSARSFGLHGILFDNPENVRRLVYNLLGNPVTRARKFLAENAGRLDTVTSSGITFSENFSQLLIFELTGDKDLVKLVEHPRIWNFFHGKGILTTEDYPCDMDTTSLALTTVNKSKDVAVSVMEEMLEYLSTDGIILTYFDRTRIHFDPVVCVNVLHLFYRYGQGYRLERTLDWVHSVLLNRAYLQGTRYYVGPEPFLFFLTRLLQSTNDAKLHARFAPLLKERIQELIGLSGDASAFAMRIIVCDFVGIRNETDFRALLPLQCEDGGWETGWLYVYGRSGIKIGNRGLTTALALSACEIMTAPRKLLPVPVWLPQFKYSLAMWVKWLFHIH